MHKEIRKLIITSKLYLFRTRECIDASVGKVEVCPLHQELRDRERERERLAQVPLRARVLCVCILREPQVGVARAMNGFAPVNPRDTRYDAQSSILMLPKLVAGPARKSVSKGAQSAEKDISLASRSKCALLIGQEMMPARTREAPELVLWPVREEILRVQQHGAERGEEVAVLGLFDAAEVGAEALVRLAIQAESAPAEGCVRGALALKLLHRRVSGGRQAGRMKREGREKAGEAAQGLHRVLAAHATGDVPGRAVQPAT